MAIDMGTRMAYTEDVGRARYELYRGANVRLKEALESGFWIEAIALIESILSDRLEARYSFIKQHDDEARKHKTIGALVRRLVNSDKKIGNEALHVIYDDIGKWANGRNRAVHHAVKISDGEQFERWDDRYGGLEKVAKDGKKLVSRISAELKRLKRESEKQKTIKPK